MSRSNGLYTKSPPLWRRTYDCKRLFLTVLLALALVSTVLTTCLAASGLAFGAFLAITAARSLGVFLFMTLYLLFIH